MDLKKMNQREAFDLPAPECTTGGQSSNPATGLFSNQSSEFN